MTCEVIVMNQRGIALAADSAVTLGTGDKIYHSAEKLFPLGSSPVGIMTYGNADFMGMPWEIIVKAYAGRVEESRFDSLEEYALDFLDFVETNDSFFPKDVQQAYVRAMVGDYWRALFVDPLKGESDRDSKVLKLLDDERVDWAGRGFVEDVAYGERVVSEYEPVLQSLEDELFAETKLSETARNDLRQTVKDFYTRDWSEPWESAIVVAGIGEAEPFPSYRAYNVGSIAAGKLRYAQVGEGTITRDDGACVAPFAQRDMVDLFYCGIHPRLRDTISEIFGAAIEDALPNDQASSKLLESIMSEALEAIDAEIEQNYNQPLIDAVDALPRLGLASMAEALVRLTEFRRQSSTAEIETVAGPIDVALISKGEGFVWVKQKSRIEESTSKF